jgi:uncharacterized membrane protein (UPF0127 family)
MTTTGSRSRRAPVLAALLAALLTSCAGRSASADGPNPALRAVELRIGGATVSAEVARTAAEREKGLMFRKSLADGKGMLFVFDSDQRVGFWMKNTTIPLSLAYIGSDRAIKQIVDLEPLSLESVRSERSVRYALEVPRGWFGRAGAKVGDLVEMPSFD